MSTIDRQRYAAVRTMEALGMAWDGKEWRGAVLVNPTTIPRALRENDYELLIKTVLRHFGLGYEHMPTQQVQDAIAEIKTWGWLK